jgi:hypothetical protein
MREASSELLRVIDWTLVAPGIDRPSNRVDDVTTLIAIGTAEIVATAALVAFRGPGVALAILAAGIAIVLRWAKEQRDLADASVVEQIATANGLRAASRYREAWALAHVAAGRASRSRSRSSALTLLARVALEEGQIETARDVLQRVPRDHRIDLPVQVAIERADASTIARRAVRLSAVPDELDRSSARQSPARIPSRIVSGSRSAHRNVGGG